MSARLPRFTLKPLPPTEDWSSLTQSQRDLWIDYAAGQQSPWLDFQTRNRTGQQTWWQEAAIQSAWTEAPTSPLTLPEPPVWESRLIYATEFQLSAAPVFRWLTRATPTLATRYLVFASAPAETSSAISTDNMPFLAGFSVGEGNTPGDPTRDLSAYYEAIFGALSGHVGKFILAIVFQTSGGGCRYDYSSLATVAEAP